MMQIETRVVGDRIRVDFRIEDLPALVQDVFRMPAIRRP